MESQNNFLWYYWENCLLFMIIKMSEFIDIRITIIQQHINDKRIYNLGIVGYNFSSFFIE